MTVPRSHIECLGEERTRCGYCRTRYTSRNFGVWAHTLDVRDYQALLDAGWRRSGAYLYRPDLHSTCCPCFVIRLDAARHTPTASHKRVLKRLRRFANTPALSPASSSVSAADPAAGILHPPAALPRGRKGEKERGPVPEIRAAVQSALADALNDILLHPRDADLFPSRMVVDQVRPTIKLFPPRAEARPKRNSAPVGKGAAQSSSDSHRPERKGSQPVLVCNAAMLLAAAERKARAASPDSPAEAILGSHIKGPSRKSAPVSKQVKQEQMRRQVDLANVISRHLTERLVLCPVTVTEPGFLNFWKDDNMEDIEDDTELHRSLPSRLTHQFGSHVRRRPESVRRHIVSGMIPLSRVGSDVSSDRIGTLSDLPSPAPYIAKPSSGLKPNRVRSRSHGMAIAEEISGGKSFTMDFVPSQFRLEAFEVFRKYQMSVHKEPPEQCTEDTYRRFLVDSPLVQSRSPLDPERWYGSFHIMYRIRGRLFAVGVVDILPRCLSSVYLFYDPDFAKLSPGTLSALNEIEWVKRASNIYPSLQFYYMGYYIHSCPKMKYKASYHPSEILCEITKNWIPAKDVMEILERTQGRQLRLAPPLMPPAPECENFGMLRSEVEILTDEAKFRIEFGHGPDDMKMITFHQLHQMLPFDYRKQLDMVRSRVRSFISLVGRYSSKFFMYEGGSIEIQCC